MASSGAGSRLGTITGPSGPHSDLLLTGLEKSSSEILRSNKTRVRRYFFFHVTLS